MGVIVRVIRSGGLGLLRHHYVRTFAKSLNVGDSPTSPPRASGVETASAVRRRIVGGDPNRRDVFIFMVVVSVSGYLGCRGWRCAGRGRYVVVWGKDRVIGWGFGPIGAKEFV